MFTFFNFKLDLKVSKSKKYTPDFPRLLSLSNSFQAIVFSQTPNTRNPKSHGFLLRVTICFLGETKKSQNYVED